MNNTHQENKPALLRPGSRLRAAIRRFTVDADGGSSPNGPAEQALGMLGDALAKGQVGAARDAYVAYLKTSADDVGELRRAAEEWFEEDFTSEAPGQ